MKDLENLELKIGDMEPETILKYLRNKTTANRFRQAVYLDLEKVPVRSNAVISIESYLPRSSISLIEGFGAMVIK